MQRVPTILYKPCAVSRCPMPATFTPVLVIRAPERLEPCGALRMPVDYPVCKDHRDLLGVKDVLDDQGWSRIVKVVCDEGAVVPDRSRTTLEFHRRKRRRTSRT